MFSCEYCEIFKNIYFVEHLGTAASNFHIDGFVYIQETNPQKITWKIQETQCLTVKLIKLFEGILLILLNASAKNS